MKKFLLSAIFLFSAIIFLCAAEPVHIWGKDAKRGRNVVMTAYLPENQADGITEQGKTLANPTPAVIVCPGGSYFWLDKKTEGHEVAQWLCSRGIAAFVLEYRVGGKFNYPFFTRLLYRGNRFPDMLCDIHRTIQLIRENHKEYNVNPGQLGVMGFSAGGHLSMMSAEYSGSEYLKELGYDPQVSLKPDFVVPVYPVVTMTDKRYVHRRSRRGLMGEGHVADKALRDKLSLEKNVPQDCCPVFLLNCTDDNVVEYHNSVLLDSALTAKGIPHLYTQFPAGGHGFGCREIRRGDQVYDWKPIFLEWLPTVLK